MFPRPNKKALLPFVEMIVFFSSSHVHQTEVGFRQRFRPEWRSTCDVCPPWIDLHPISQQFFDKVCPCDRPAMGTVVVFIVRSFYFASRTG